MDKDRFQIITPTTNNDYRTLVRGLTKEVWPEFMLHDRVANEHWHELLDRFAEYQFALYDVWNNRVAGMGNSFPLRWDDNLSNLPEEGWDWAFQKAVDTHKKGISPNMHCAIQIVLRSEYQGQGLSTPMVEAVRAVTTSHALRCLIIPLRPSEKSKYPLTRMEDYITWKTEDGFPLDAWLRVHIKLGARMIKVCQRSKTITGSCRDWEAWTGMKFPQSGQYVIPGGLSPVQINVENDEGLYIEPNVWIVHERR